MAFSFIIVTVFFSAIGSQATVISPHLYRVLGGETGTAKTFQFFLASSSPTRHDFGSAVLITERHAITAGKLIAGFHKWVLAYGGPKLGPQLKIIDSKIAFLHPAYDILTNENDLGIILLPSILNNNYLKPIALPLTNVIVPRNNEEGSVSGFGITDDISKPAPHEDIKTTYMTVVKETECPITDFSKQETSNFCARDVFFGSRLCRGDVGSGFIVLQRGIPTLAGIASQVSQKCAANSGHDASSFVKIHTYLGWIKALTGLE